MKFDTVSRISEFIYITDNESSKNIYNTDKESKDLRVTFNENSTKTKIKPVNNELLQQALKNQIIHKRNNDPKMSRNIKDVHSNSKFKTQTLPALNNRSTSVIKKPNKSSPKALFKPKSKPQLNQLAITDGSNFPTLRLKNPQQSLTVKDKGVASKTSRQFAPKLNKDLPISPRQEKPKAVNIFGNTKRSLQNPQKDPYLGMSTNRGKKLKTVDEGIQTVTVLPQIEAAKEPYYTVTVPQHSEEYTDRDYVALLTSKLDNDKKFSKVIENLDKLKSSPGHSFYKQCMKSQRDIQKTLG